MRKKYYYWEKTRRIELMPRDELLELQWKKLRYMINYAYNNTILYHEKWDKAGIKPEDIKSKDDFQKKAPLITKDDIREKMKQGDPYGGTLGVPPEKLHCIASSSGTTGLPTLVGLTKEGWEIHRDEYARVTAMVGCKPGYKILLGGVRWHSGWAAGLYDEACRLLGMTVISSDGLGLHPFMINRNLYYAQHLKPEVLWQFPSTFIRMEEEAKKSGLDPEKIFSCFKIMILGGEPVLPNLRRKWETNYGAEIFEWGGYGSDLCCVFLECQEHHGKHVCEDLFFIEDLDPENLEPVAPMERGRVVLSTLWNEATPHIRFATEDVLTYDPEICNCGRTHMRVWQLGRMTDIVNVKDKRILPWDVESILREIPETETVEYMLVRYAKGPLAKLKVHIEYTPTMGEKEGVKRKIEREISDKLGIPVEIEFVSKEAIMEKQKLKAIRVLDTTDQP